MKIRYPLFFFLLTSLLGTTQATASIDVYISDRDENSLGLEASWEDDYAYVSQLDCNEDISFELTIDISDEDTDGREIYIFSGSNCDDSDDDDDCDDDVLKLNAEDMTVDIPISWIFDGESCSDNDSTSIWVGLLENAGEKDDNATWASSISFDLDGSAPEAPTSVFAEPGDEKLLVSFSYDDDDSFEGALLLYAVAEQQAEAGDAGVADDDVDGGVSDDCTGALVEGADVTGDLSYVEVSGESVAEGYIRHLTNGVTYQVAVSAIDENGNLSPISEVICETPGETIGFLEEYLDAGGSTGEYCFIATAAFGDYDHPTVRILRAFRDRFLLTFALGKRFVALYYRVGPTLAAHIQSDTTKYVIRVLLTLFSGVAILLTWMGPGWTVLLAAAVLLLFFFCAAMRYRRYAFEKVKINEKTCGGG